MAKRRTTQPVAAGAASSDAPVMEELGINNIMPANTWSNWTGANIPEGSMLVGRDPLAPSQDELVFMLRRDGQAQAMLSLLMLPIRAAFAKDAWLAPEKGGEQETEFANKMWNLPHTAGGMSVSRSMFLRQTLLALAYGFSAFEVVRKIPTEGPLAGKIVLDKMGYRDPRTVQFLSDENGNFQGFRQVTNFAGRSIDVTIPKRDAWYWAANEEMNPLYGVSYFEPAFQHYQMKRKLYYIAHLAAQMAAVPGRVGEVPLGATRRQITEFKAGLSNFAFNTAMITPPNFKVSPFNANSNFDFIKMIDHHNMMMTTSILAKFLQQEDRQVLIDNGKADASADMFVQLLEAITFELSESWTTRLMPQFIDANFGTGVYPIHRFAPLTDATKEAILSLFTTMATASNLNVTPEFVRITEMKLSERLGYDIDYAKVAAEDTKFQNAQQEAAQEAQQPAQDTAQPQGENNSGGSTPREPTPRQGASKPPVPAGNTVAGRRLPTALPTPNAPSVKLSDKQKSAMDQIALALNALVDAEDVPEWFQDESEPVTIPEAEE